ncbi:cell wall-binding repeat-containing protein [Planococcus sp. X10-3]|uniref:cell wall-binding repeat-containing protein n=1 Tax=Planococcus sp. X10-3 TaxID=3061240 RepID=UPI003BB197C8
MLTKKKVVFCCFLPLFFYPTHSSAAVDHSLSFENSTISLGILYDQNLKYPLHQQIGGNWLVPKDEDIWIDKSLSKRGGNSIGFKLAPAESRVELKLGDMKNNQIKYIGFSMYVPSDFQPPTHWNLFAQWWQGAPASPPVAFEFASNVEPLGILIISRDGTSIEFNKRTHYTRAIQTNAWTDFIVKMRIDDTGGENGILTVWRNGEIIVDYQGRLGYTDLYTHTNFRFGLYRAGANDSLINVYFDEVKMGSSYIEVVDIRISGDTRYETAVVISKEGWETADTVVLATAADFPDALAGGPLAYQEDAPILLTRTATLGRETKAEIARLGADKVIILGSKGAVSVEVENELRQMGLAIDRIGGKNRFDTAAMIAKRLNSTEAVLAYGFNFPDVLSVSAYASRNGIPILLTRTDKLPPETIAALESTTKTHVIGSEGAVSDEVFMVLPNPVRYGGKDRYATGLEVNSKLKMSTGKAFIATGTNFPDALAGSVLAAKNDAPILLVKGDTIPEETATQLGSYESYAIFGGAGAVGEPVLQLLSMQLNN